MIGNDVVDIQLAKIESNWRRKGYLDKIFTEKEQFYISNSLEPDIAVWNLWSRKEAAYKIWNSLTGLRKYNPLKLECQDFESEIGQVIIENSIYYTKTLISNKYIHTTAATNLLDLHLLEIIDNSTKKNDYNSFKINKLATSKSHHGNFEFIVYLQNP